MSRARVLVTRSIPNEGLKVLREVDDIELVVHDEDFALGRERLIAELAEAHGVISLLDDCIDARVLESAPHLKIVANYAVGYDNIDVTAASRRGVWVTNTPDVLTDATADCTVALLLACARRVVEADQYVRQGFFTGWKPQLLLGVDLAGGTVGIIGLGRIGRAVARRLQAFGMKVVYHNRHRLDDAVEQSLGVTYKPLDELVSMSDVVSLHCPGGIDSRHIIDARRLSLMKKSAILVNTGRGCLVDEDALVHALREARIRGAALDVFEQEPKVHDGLVSLPQVVLAPHIGSATEGTRAQMALMAARNIIAVLRGDIPPHAVNQPKGVRF